MLIKRAETSDDDLKKARNRALASAGIGTAGSIGSTYAILKSIPHAVGDELDLTDREVKNLRRLLGGHKRNVKLEPLPKDFAFASHFNPKTNTVRAPKNSPLLAHEYGHSTSPLFAGRGKPIGLSGTALTHGIGFRYSPLVRAYTAYKNETEGKKTKGRQAADALAIGGTALGLAEEGQASLRGYNALKRLRGKEYANTVAKKLLLPAYGTYLAAAGTGHLVAPAVGKYLGKLKRRRLEEAERASGE